MKRILVIGVMAAALAIVGAPKAEAASVLQIQFSGINYLYNGTNLCDGDGCNAPPGSPDFSLADPLVTMSFILDGNLLGTFTNGIGIDMNLPVGVLALNVLNTGSGGHLDLYIGGTWGLALDVANWQAGVGDALGSFFLLGGGTVTNIFGQALPFGLTMLTPVEFTFSGSNLVGNASSFTASGTGEVDGPVAVPEPASLLLLGTGLLGLAAAYRRRMKA